MMNSFTPDRVSELTLLGETVICRIPKMSRSGEQIQVAHISAIRDLTGGLVCVRTLEHGYIYSNVRYDRSLSHDNTWCKKEDLVVKLASPSPEASKEKENSPDDSTQVEQPEADSETSP